MPDQTAAAEAETIQNSVAAAKINKNEILPDFFLRGIHTFSRARGVMAFGISGPTWPDELDGGRLPGLAGACSGSASSEMVVEIAGMASTAPASESV